MIVKWSPKISPSTPAASIDFKGTHSSDKEQRCNCLLCSPWDIKKKLLKVVITNLRFAVPEKGDWVIPVKEKEKVKKGTHLRLQTVEPGFEICGWIGLPQMGAAFYQILTPAVAGSAPSWFCGVPAWTRALQLLCCPMWVSCFGSGLVLCCLWPSAIHGIKIFLCICGSKAP